MGDLVVKRRRHAVRAGGGGRDLYAQHLRDAYEHRPLFWGHFKGRVARLEAGEPVVVRWWEIAPFVSGMRDPRGGLTTQFVRLESNGSVQLVEPVRDGIDIVDWRPAA